LDDDKGNFVQEVGENHLRGRLRLQEVIELLDKFYDEKDEERKGQCERQKLQVFSAEISGEDAQLAATSRNAFTNGLTGCAPPLLKMPSGYR
jgi:hypothetical protein